LDYFYGVDIGKFAHHAVCVDETGSQLESRPLANTQPDIDDLVGRVSEAGGSVIVDQPKGGAALLIQACWDKGIPVGYLHGFAMARARGFYEGESKTDPKDAFVLADIARSHPSRIVWIQPLPEERAKLEVLVGYDEDMRADVNRQSNRLRALLSGYWPQLERAIGDRLATRPVLDLLDRYPNPEALRRLGKGRVTRFLSQRRMRKPDVFAEAILSAIHSQHTVVAGSRSAGRVVSELATEIGRLLSRRKELEGEIEECFLAQPEAEILTSLPGVGVRLGARILVEVGDISQFASPSKLASYAGLGPAPWQSGTVNTAYPSRRGNHRLKNALFLSAFASLRHPPSRTYYDRKRKEGKQHHDALLCLARRRVDVLHAMLTRGQSYYWEQQAA